MSQQEHRISIRLFKVKHLHEILKRLHKSYQANKQELIRQIQESQQADPERTNRIIIDVYNMYYAHVKEYDNTAGSSNNHRPKPPQPPPNSSSSSSGYSASPAIMTSNNNNNISMRQGTVDSTGARPAIRSGFAQHNVAASAQNRHPHAAAQQQPIVLQQGGLPQQEIRRSFNRGTIERLILNHHQGLLESCRVLGGVVVEKRAPNSNQFTTPAITADEFMDVGKQSRVILRFVVHNPSTDVWFLPPIWPKESKLVMNGQPIFDTMTKNKLAFKAVGQKDPLPAVDISEKYKSGGRLDSIFIDFSPSAIASGVRWMVVAALIKRKTEDQILNEVKMRSPSMGECVSRVLRFFQNDEEDVMLEESELSLKDPASFGPIVHAVRSADCKHLQCFDLFTYLIMNEAAREPKWKCPKCGSDAAMKKLVMDAWFQKAIGIKNDSMPNSSKFKVKPDGEPNILPEEDDDDDDYSSDDEREQQEVKRMQLVDEQSAKPVVQPVVKQAPPPPRRGKSREDAIELLDDDDLLY